MQFSEVFISILIFIMLIPTIASITKFDQWWIRGFDFPRIQISFLIFVVAVVTILVWEFDASWKYFAVGILLLSLMYQIVKIFPYTYLSKPEVLKFAGEDPDTSISILVSNVLTTNRDSHKLIDLVRDRDPDILLTLESDKRWEKELEVLEGTYKNTVKVPLDNLYGMHLYSKLKLDDIEVKYLVQDDIPSIHGSLYLENEERIEFHCLHPKPPSPTESATSTNRDAELLLMGRDLDPEHERVLVFGDLNDVAWSRTTELFHEISGLLDPRIGRGFFNTYNANYKLFRWPLDHVFHTKDFTLIEIARERHVGSDHFPMYIKLNLEPIAEKVQKEPEASEDDKEWADEKIEDAQPLEKDK